MQGATVDLVGKLINIKIYFSYNSAYPDGLNSLGTVI